MEQEAIVKAINESLDEKFNENFDPLKERVENLEKQTEALEKKTEPMIVSGEDKDAWKDVFGKDLRDLMSGQKTVVTLSDVAGTVPESWIREVFRIPCDYGAFLQSNPRIVPMAEAINMARKHSSTNVSLTWTSQGSGEGVEEGVTEGATTAKSVDRDTLIANVPLSRQSVRYSFVDLVNYFTDRLREEYNGELDDQAFNGNANPFTGIFNATDVNQITMDDGHDSIDNISRDYLLQMIHSPKASVRGSAGWFVSNSILGLIHRKVVDENKRPLFDYQTNSILGYPVWVSEKMPEEADDAAGTDMLIYGSSRIGIVYATEGFEVAVSEHAEFKKNNIVLRVTADIALYVILPAAFVKLTTGTP